MRWSILKTNYAKHSVAVSVSPLRSHYSVRTMRVTNNHNKVNIGERDEIFSTLNSAPHSSRYPLYVYGIEISGQSNSNVCYWFEVQVIKNVCNKSSLTFSSEKLSCSMIQTLCISMVSVASDADDDVCRMG